MFEECAAEALHDGADDLPVQCHWIDDPADIAHRDVIDHLDVSCPRVDGNMGGVRAIAVGMSIAEECAVGLQIFRCEVGPADHVAVGRCRHPGFKDDVFRGAIQPQGGGGADGFLQVLRGVDDGGAAHHRGARTKRAEAFVQVGRRSVKDPDAFHRNFQRIGGDLHAYGFQPLADDRGADIDGDRPVAFEHHAGIFPRTDAAAFDEAGDRRHRDTGLRSVCL